MAPISPCANLIQARYISRAVYSCIPADQQYSNSRQRHSKHRHPTDHPLKSPAPPKTNYNGKVGPSPSSTLASTQLQIRPGHSLALLTPGAPADRHPFFGRSPALACGRHAGGADQYRLLGGLCAPATTNQDISTAGDRLRSKGRLAPRAPPSLRRTLKITNRF
jgi:hypothetical protein